MACEQKATLWKPFSKDIYMLRLITRQIQNISKQYNIISNQLHALQHAMFRDKTIEKMHTKQLVLLQKNKKDLQKRVELIVNNDEFQNGNYEKSFVNGFQQEDDLLKLKFFPQKFGGTTATGIWSFKNF